MDNLFGEINLRYIAICIVLSIIVMTSTFIYSATHWRNEAIAHGAARFNPTTGEFEWMNNVKTTK